MSHAPHQERYALGRASILEDMDSIPDRSANDGPSSYIPENGQEKLTASVEGCAGCGQCDLRSSRLFPAPLLNR